MNTASPRTRRPMISPRARSNTSSAIGGIEVRTGVALGKEVSLADLRAKYDAVFLGFGLAGVNGLGLDGEQLEGVVNAVDYIATLRQAPTRPRCRSAAASS